MSAVAPPARRLRILLHSSYYAPELTAIAKYNDEMMRWLARRGHEVRVVSTVPHFPAWRVADGYSNWRWSHEHQGGVPVWRCPAYIPSRPGALRRVLYSLGLTLSSLPTLLRQAVGWRPDVIIGVEPPLLAFAAARLAAAVAGARAWLHVQDLEVDAAFELAHLRGSAPRRLALALESALMSGCDRVSTISVSMRERLAAKGVPAERLFLLRNWVDLSAMPADATGTAYRRELALPEGARVALYAGNMSAKQGLETLVETARALAAREDLWFVLVGDGALRESLVQQARGLPRVRFLPIQPAERMAGLLALADVHLLPQRRAAADLVMPSKLCGMLASGRPTVAGAEPGTELARMVEGCGLRVAPEEPAEMAAAVARLLDDPALARSLGRRARERAAQELDMHAQLERLEAELLQLARPGPGPRSKLSAPNSSSP